ncbi:MAG: S8 family peptidase, partial [Gammaproteobacteria bacterium]
MRSLSFYLLLGCWLVMTACATNADLPSLGDSETGEDRRLVVAFVDKTISRTSPGNVLDTYRARGRYGNSGWSERLAKKLADRYELRIVAQWPVTALGVSCVVYDVPAHFSLDRVISTLQTDKQVALVQRMQTFDVQGMEEAFPESGGDPYLSLQTGFKAYKILEMHKIATGRGIRIALIDSGVDLSHPDLTGQIRYSQNVAPEPLDHNLADVHGTAVAGILVARPNNGIGIAGIAPDAELMAFRACWPSKPGTLAARCNSFTLAVALNQAIRKGAHIINLSLSGANDPLVRQLVKAALERDIIVIAAVPGQTRAGGFPANVPGVLAVGTGEEAELPDIIAPGQDILTTVPHQAYDFMTG